MVQNSILMIFFIDTSRDSSCREMNIFHSNATFTCILKSRQPYTGIEVKSICYGKWYTTCWFVVISSTVKTISTPPSPIMSTCRGINILFGHIKYYQSPKERYFPPKFNHCMIKTMSFTLDKIKLTNKHIPISLYIILSYLLHYIHFRSTTFRKVDWR